MAESKKYYWLKLKRDFFKRHDIRIIEEMPNGKDYILFYLKLLLESIDHDGNLRFSDAIPYNEQMLSVVTNTNIDIVRSAMKIFIELNMMDILDDKTIYMTEVDKLIGCETKWAEKKRLYRAKGDNVQALSAPRPTDVRQEIEKDKEIDIDKEIEKNTKKKADDLIIGFNGVGGS
jgi:predicted phage replisome organizer